MPKNVDAGIRFRGGENFPEDVSSVFDRQSSNRIFKALLNRTSILGKRSTKSGKVIFI